MFSLLKKIFDKKNNNENQTGKKNSENPVEKKPGTEKNSVDLQVKKRADLEKIKKDIVKITDFINDLNQPFNTDTEKELDVKSPFEIDNCTENQAETHNKVGFVVLGSGSYVSVNLFDSLTPYAKNGYRIVLFLDTKKVLDEAVKKKLEKLRLFKNVVIVNLTEKQFDFAKIQSAAKLLQCIYTVFLTLRDKINPRSFVTNINSVISTDTCKKVYIPDDIDCTRLDKYWNFSSLSGCFFDTEFLTEIDYSAFNGKFWCLKKITSVCDFEHVCVYRNDFIINTCPSVKIISSDIANVGKEIVAGITNNMPVDELLEQYQYAVRDMYRNFELSKIQSFFLYSMTSYVLFMCEKKNIDTELWKEKFNRIFDFGMPIKAKETQRLYNLFLPVMFPKKDNDLFIVENVGMSDVKNSKFYELATENFSIDYQLKRSSFDYYDFNNMIIKMHAKSSKLTIASGSLNRNMLSDGDRHLTLWHGLGWMKKTVVKPDKFTVGDIVCSSEYCAPRYKEHFFASSAIPLGSVQTDKLFDEVFRKECNRLVRETHGIPLDSKIIFFAPTFRIGSQHHYYDFGMDIEELSEALKNNNTYLITKKHHVFESLLRDKGIDASGVRNSKNGHFIVDENYDFNQLICACDAFATDYSSGMYYAFTIDLPVFLYAIDVDDYLNGANGLEIKYPESVPVPFVGEPSVEKFIQAYKDSFKSVQTTEYAAYKEDNVGACDGHVGEKLVEYIRNNYLQ